jgi:[ribosomal protein S5]-alanine N-acetyltransferase
MKLVEPLMTERLMLRTLEPADAGGAYLAWMNDPEIMRFTESRYASHDAAALKGFIEAMNASEDNLLLGLIATDQGSHIGNIKLGPIDRRHQRAWIGIIIGDRARWGQGLASEAIDAIAQCGLEDLGLRRIAAGIYGDNRGSVGAFAKAGFREVARLPGWSLSEGASTDDIIMMRGEDM